MTIEALIIWLVIGAIAGWLLPRIGFILVGGIAAKIVNAVIGVLLAVIGFVKKTT